jgi:hypothetical protein
MSTRSRERNVGNDEKDRIAVGNGLKTLNRGTPGHGDVGPTARDLVHVSLQDRAAPGGRDFLETTGVRAAAAQHDPASRCTDVVHPGTLAEHRHEVPVAAYVRHTEWEAPE